MQYEHLLSQYCAWNDIAFVKGTLEHSNVDLTYDDGIYFKYAILYKNSEMLEVLLSYYRKEKLSSSYNSLEYRKAYANLHKLLEDVLDGFDQVSPEVI